MESKPRPTPSSLKESNITKIVMLSGLIIVISILMVGYQAYSSSRQAVLKGAYQNNMLLAQTFRNFASAQKSSSEGKSVLNYYRDMWFKMQHPYKGSFLCVVDSQGNLSLHTSTPNREGVFVGNNMIHPDNQIRLNELIKAKTDYVGPYLSSTGKNQIAAFSYVEPLQSVVSVHVPLEEIEAQVTQAMTPWLLGLLAIGAVLFPLLLWFLQRAFLSIQGKLKQANTRLSKEIKNRKQAETELEKHRFQLEELVDERTIELRNANHELESFCYSVSHDLRTPLRSIDGFSAALLEDYSKNLDTDAQEYLNRIRANSQHLGMLIDDLLKLSRVTRGEIFSKKINLSKLANSIANYISNNEKTRTAEFLIQENITVYADENLLRVALENLIDNAWKYTQKNKQAKITVGSKTENDELICFIKDNGIGFDMQLVQNLFMPFHRLHHDEELPGSGVGLATVYRIIQRHGGRIWGEGTPGQGAIFYFTLPTINEDNQVAA